MAMVAALTRPTAPTAKRDDVNGENEKGKRAGEGGGRKGRDKLMRICASEQVSAKKEEGRGRREQKSQRKSMREQASVNSFTF